MSSLILWLLDRFVDLERWTAERSRALRAAVERSRLRRKIVRDEALKRKLREVAREKGASP